MNKGGVCYQLTDRPIQEYIACTIDIDVPLP